MENRKPNELNDETLDAVTGGASYQWNEKTGEYDVFSKDGRKLFSVLTEESAQNMVISRSLVESMQEAHRKGAPW